MPLLFSLTALFFSAIPAFPSNNNSEIPTFLTPLTPHQKNLPNSPQLASSAINSAGIKIFQQIFKTQDNSTPNICISPLSLVTALAMAYSGSEGTTRSQFAHSLNFPKNPTTLADSFSLLFNQILPPHKTDSSIHFAVRLYAQAGYHFRQSFLDFLQNNFRTSLEQVDFSANPPDIAEKINNWVENKTNNHIQNIIPPNALSAHTRLVLINALHFLSSWAQEFSSSKDFFIPFHTSTGSRIDTPAMRAERHFGFLDFPFTTAVAVPYLDTPYQLLLFLPKSSLADLIQKLNPDFLFLFSQIPYRKILLTLPKVNLSPPTLHLRQTLIQLGIPSAFDIPPHSANFNNIAPIKPNDYLFIDEVFHKVSLNWDEKGTEASASTAIAMLRATAAPHEEDPPLIITFDRPFLFAIQHAPTTTLLFLGIISDPSSS
ncbi:MAG: serpin family protein [Chthoniobacterales bacterium]|nr:serpin family protein [Chthoniobacterales bacterium]